MLRRLLIPAVLVAALKVHGQAAPAAPHAEESVTVRAQSAPEGVSAATAALLVDASSIEQMTTGSRATGFSDLVTRTTPGVAADSNGFAHPLGEHADTAISLDGQPITDQTAKVFSNQLDPAIIDTMVATTGAPSAEFGGKTSLTLDVRTRSGLNRKPAGTVFAEGGSFRTGSGGITLGMGGARMGNFFALAGTRSDRFLDAPETVALHDRGSNFSMFDRVDFQPTGRDTLHLNLGAGRSSFQTPNSYDTAAAGQDQRSLITNANFAFGWSHAFSPSFLLTATPWLRRDHARYMPSPDPLRDDTASLAQDRTLLNTGARVALLAVRGPNTLKAGVTYSRTLLHERFSVGLTDPLYNAPCTDATGSAAAAPGVRDASACAALGLSANPDFLPGLLPFDLSRGGSPYRFDDAAAIGETALYAQDELRLGRWTLSPGLRYDVYNGLSRGRQLQPRVAVAFRAPWSGTVLRGSYARLYETPYNENLLFANDAATAGGPANPFATFRSEPVRPGARNQFNIGFQQPLGRHLVLDADYYWKFTRTAFDFDTLFNTPITFSVAWRKSKIDGLAVRLNLEDVHGWSAYSVMGHVRSRFFTPEVGGLIFNGVPSSPVFRIDHGEEFEHTTSVRYQLPRNTLGRHRPYAAAVWRYNSGLALPNTVPTYADALKLTADQQAQMGVSCGGDTATPTHAITACSAADFRSSRVRIPTPGTYDDDRNPVRVAARNLFDLSVGDDDLLRMEHASFGLRVSAVNAGNATALYNFLSTFSGTHFVPSRSVSFTLQATF